MGRIINAILEIFSIETAVFITSMLPLIELRGSIPLGVSLGLSPREATLLSLAGSIIPVPIILFTVRPVFNYLKKKRRFRNLINKITERSIKKDGERVKKYGFLGLIILVAIPLPGTGVWSGSLIASLLNMRFKLAFPAIVAGNLLAAVQIMMLSSGVMRLIS
jgi:uncharacterized membrane protein